MKISSALCTISHFTADFGPRFSQEIVPKLAVNPKILSVELEPSSAVYRTSDPDVAKHFTAVIREMYTPLSGENVIVVAALLEMDHANVPAGVPAVQHILGLDTEGKREAFLDQCVVGTYWLLEAYELIDQIYSDRVRSSHPCPHPKWSRL